MTERRYPVTTVDLLRHGRCQGGDIFRGATDSPLTDEGWQQMSAALARHSGWQRVISSPKLRCRAFAGSFASEHKLPLQVVDDLREIDFGAWEGRTPGDIQQDDSDLLQAYYRNPNTVTPPGGESLDSACVRFSGVWNQLLARYRDEHLLMVAHGGTLRLLLANLLQAPMASSRFFAVPPASLIRLSVYHTPEGLFPQLIFHQPEPTL
ncbi:MAG: histidine phosphatase family protein [Porticoccaceae bacterium]|nr:histidine phosphatase family protein [Porticoccaceae bacterium]